MSKRLPHIPLPGNEFTITLKFVPGGPVHYQSSAPLPPVQVAQIFTSIANETLKNALADAAKQLTKMAEQPHEYENVHLDGRDVCVICRKIAGDLIHIRTAGGNHGGS